MSVKDHFRILKNLFLLLHESFIANLGKILYDFLHETSSLHVLCFAS